MTLLKNIKLINCVYEIAENIESVVLREKQLNHWQKDWKFNLIKKIIISLVIFYSL